VADPDDDKALITTSVACAPGTAISSNPPDNVWVSRTGVNQYSRNDYPSHLTDTHQAGGVFTAPSTGCQPYTCWLVYACNPKAENTSVTFRAGATLRHYGKNERPGTNWIVPWGEDVLVTSTSAVTPGGSQLWNAGTSTATKTKVSVEWYPRLTNCVAGDSQCPDTAEGHNADTYFDWRISVYQYSGSRLCNKNLGPWMSGTRIPWHHHHFDTYGYKRTVPIVVGTGTDGSCGSQTSSRQFRVIAQIRKTYDNGKSDINVHDGGSNLTVFAY
jgi:hypothetical protein